MDARRFGRRQSRDLREVQVQGLLAHLHHERLASDDSVRVQSCAESEATRHERPAETPMSCGALRHLAMMFAATALFLVGMALLFYPRRK